MLSVMALSYGYGQAQSVDKDAALSLASQFFASHNSGASHRAPAQVAPVLSYTAATKGTPDFYVFNRGADVPGFVIINANGADDEAILGYSDSATFDYDTAPDALRWWLEQYQRCGIAKAPAQTTTIRHDVTPLIQTKWDQHSPFNDLIPHSVFVPFVTGCTATAMAQIMKHYAYPTKGKGSKSYTVTYFDAERKEFPITYSADFGSTTYKWADMLDDYKQGEYTSAQGNAVATIMYHAGVAESTVFNGTSSEADDRHSGVALINYFDYDCSMLRAERQFVSDDDWDEIVYNELAQGRPLMYSGQNAEDTDNSVGHSFICDGYDASNHTFHMNWGWSGNWNGYFRLTGSDALLPDGTGTGGGAQGSAYVYHQAINYNISPNHSGSVPIQVGLIAGGELSVTSTSDAISSYTHDRNTSEETVLHYSLSPYNYGLNSVAFEYGVMFRDNESGRTYISKEGDTNNLKDRTMPPGYFYVVDPKVQKPEPAIFDHTFSTSLLTEPGRYEVLPAFRPIGKGEWRVADYDLSLNIPVITVIGDYVSPAEPLVPELINGICFYDYPTIGTNNLADASHLELNMPVTNNTDSSKAISLYGFVGLDYTNVEIPVNGKEWPAGTMVKYTSDFSDLKTVMTAGRTYTIYFYTDSSKSTPMNVPSITFYYDGDSVTTISDVSAIISNAQEGNAPVKLVKAAVDRALGK